MTNEPSSLEDYDNQIRDLDRVPSFLFTAEMAEKKLALDQGREALKQRGREQLDRRIAALNAQATPPTSTVTRTDPQLINAGIAVAEDRIRAIQERLGRGWMPEEEQLRLIDEQLALERDIASAKQERGRVTEATRAASVPPIYYPPDRAWDQPLVERLHATAHAEEADGGLMAQVGLAIVAGERYAPHAEDSDEYWAALHHAFGDRVPDVLDARDGILAMLATKERAALEKSGVLRYPSLLRYLSEQWQALHDPKTGERAYRRQLARLSGSASRPGTE
jgi:hypothetical protein